MSSEPMLTIEPERYELFEGPAYQFAPSRRDFLKGLGGGVLVLLVGCEAGAAQQETGGGRRQRGGGQPAPQELGAWLHVGEDGTVTVFTGKTEVGQNIRTSLTQVVAEELKVPTGSIRLVMADTDRVPYDAGTFGSGTTPRMAPQLRRVAAAAREALLALAAARWQTDAGAVAVSSGVVNHLPTGKSLTYGELARGQELMKTVAADAPTTPAERWLVAGRPHPKVEGRGIVTGSHQYATDVRRPGMLHGRMLRAPAFGATLETLDAQAAEKIPGVTVVRDREFVGVAAPDPALAAQAMAALRAGWKTTPQPSDRELFALLKGETPPPDTLLAAMSGDAKIAATYPVAYIAHAPLEPRAAVAEWEGDRLTVWTGTQRPFGVRSNLAEAFGIPEARVRVIVPDTGSGYGGKHQSEAAIEAARLAKAAGKPVKVVWTREEEFTWAYFRPAGVIEAAAAATKDGLLTGWEFHNYNSGGSSLRSPYEVASRKEQAHQGRSPLRQGSYRALAATANTFAREVHMDDLAHAVGLDPLEFRLRNLKDPRLRAVLTAAAARFGWGKGKAAAGSGVGLAGGTEKGSYVATCAEVAVDRATGKVRLVRAVTAFECGAVLNPDHLRNQVEGAVVQGLGGALFEAIRFADGKILNPRFSRYRVPRFSDAPAQEVVLLDRKDLPSAGAGETPIIAIAPAVGNAIFQATGVRLRSLPMAPDGVGKG